MVSSACCFVCLIPMEDFHCTMVVELQQSCPECHEIINEFFTNTHQIIVDGDYDTN